MSERVLSSKHSRLEGKIAARGGFVQTPWWGREREVRRAWLRVGRYLKQKQH